MCGFFFETGIDCGNMASTMFDETLKVDVATVAARYEAVGTAHEAVSHLASVHDQEQYKVIEEFFMRISTNNITVEGNLHAAEKKADVKQEPLTKEHNKHVFNVSFEYVGVQNNMGIHFENKVVNIFDANLKLIEEWIKKQMEQIDVSFKAAARIKKIE